MPVSCQEKITSQSLGSAYLLIISATSIHFYILYYSRGVSTFLQLVISHGKILYYQMRVIELKNTTITLYPKDQTKRPGRQRIDYTDLKGGSLHVLSPTEYVDSNGGEIWIARCDCGQRCYVQPRNVKRGLVRTCGCSRLDRLVKDYSGVKKEHITLISRLPKKHKGRHLWLGVCDCGNFMTVRPSKIQKGVQISCGCKSKERLVLWGAQLSSLSRPIIIEKYGVDNPRNIPGVGEKIRNTNMRLFGTPVPIQSPDIIKKVNLTMTERYGIVWGEYTPLWAERSRNTCIQRYGVPFPMQNPEIALKCAEASNKSVKILYWKTPEAKPLNCVASYEIAFVRYMNENQIEFDWQIPFRLKNGQLYICDAYIPSLDLFVEIKGWFRGDAKLKWDEFIEAHPNSELWDKKVLKTKGII